MKALALGTTHRFKVLGCGRPELMEGCYPNSVKVTLVLDSFNTHHSNRGPHRIAAKPPQVTPT